MKETTDESLVQHTFEAIGFFKDKGDVRPLEAMVAMMMAAATLAIANGIDRELFDGGVDACWNDALKWEIDLERMH